MAKALPIILKPGYYRAVVAVTVAPGILAFCLFLAWLMFGFSPGIHFGSTVLPYWALMAIGLIPYYIASSRFVQTYELAGITVLETPAKELDDGYAYEPLWLTELHRFPRAVQQHQFPAEPEQISNLPDEEAERLGKMLMRPIRITTGGPEKGEGAEQFEDNILNEQLTLEPQVTVRWQVEREGFFEFYVNTPGYDWIEKKKNLLKSMRDSIENALNIEMSMHSAAWSVANKATLVEKVQEAIINKVDDWGISICEVNILNLVLSHDVNIALGAIPAAKARGQATVITARSGKEGMILEAEGEAERTKITEKAKGEGLKARADASEIDAETLFKTEAAIEIGKNNSKFIIGGDLLKMAEQIVGGSR